MADSPQFLSGSEIRQTFLDFYAKREHQLLPSASLVPEDPTVLLTIAGMLPFKPIFLGQRQSEYNRATTSQKCIRTNDIENVGRTARHHTFFEMLGNFSFGDYFKEQAIAWAWEICTQVFGLPPERLVVSVFQEDDDAFAIWRDQIGIPPHRIQRMGEDDNFWVSGPTGPCGPCSEIYYDFRPEQGDDIDLEDDTRFIELYNLVFMQYNRDIEGNLTPLKNQNIDTGMGLERMAQVLQKVPNNYETDLIFPIVKTAAQIAGINYAETDEKTKVSLKVIGDHVRAVVHMIADGITASNTGRGYILRRLLRRVVRHGRLIGIQGEFTQQVAETAIALSESAYPNVRQREEAIKGELQREESSFLKTLERGEKLLDKIIEQVKQEGKTQLDGQDAFTLYDTYGFPLELTQEIAEEQSLTIDLEGFEAAMQEQVDTSKGAHQTIDMMAQGSLSEMASGVAATEFLGYTLPASQAMVTVLIADGNPVESATAGTSVQVVLDQTPFYAESGGQIGDQGFLYGNKKHIEDLIIKGLADKNWVTKGKPEQDEAGKRWDWEQAEFAYEQAKRNLEIFRHLCLEALAHINWALKGRPEQDEVSKTWDWEQAEGVYEKLIGSDSSVRIEDVKKESNFFIHFGRIEHGTLHIGDLVTAQIDRACRRRAQANHTATHLLQAALKQIVDPGISQAGSLVNFDRLRFDFHCPRPVTPQELQQVEEQVNAWIAEAHDAQIEVMPIAEAKAKGAVAMFGEKYGDEVRVIDFPGVSMELCGGTHVNNTAEIGVFKIVSEGGVASGIRRIEAVAGQALLDYLNVRDKVVRELSDRFKVKPEEISDRITNLQNELKASNKQLEALKQELALAKSDQLLAQAESVGEFKILVANLGEVDPESLKTAAERLLQKLGEGAVVLASVPEPDKVSLVAAFSKNVNTKGLQAGKFIGAIAKICGGGGGGRPNLAQAGGRDASKLAEALLAAKEQLHSSL